MLHTLLVAALLNGTVVLRPQSAPDEPVGGALVELLQETTTIATATSATDGTFSISDLAPGKYSIQISSNHTKTKGTIVVRDINPNLGVDAPRTFYVFDYPCGAMFGRVRNADTGIGVPHAHVSFWGSSETDANGDYFITYLCYRPSGGYKLSGTSGMQVSARGYKKISLLVRAETVTNGVEGAVRDFEIQPVNSGRDHDRLRPHMTRDEIAAKLVELVRQEKDVPDDVLKPETVLSEAGVDSLDALTILFAIEEEFKISIPDDKAKSIKTFGDMIDVVQELKIEN